MESDALKKEKKNSKNNILKIRPSKVQTADFEFYEDKNSSGNKLNKIENKSKDSLLIANERLIKKEIKGIYEFTHVGFNGEEDKAHNQDISFIERKFTGKNDYIYMSVCDGHGVEGHNVSGFIKRILPKDMTHNLKGRDLLTNENEKKEELYTIIKYTFIKANERLVENPQINSIFSGSTCVSVIYTPYKLICANIGDSRAVLGRFDVDSKKIKAVELSRDHKPTEPDEAKRILDSGGRIKPFIDEDTGEFVGPQRVWVKDDEVPGLAMTRSFGDRVAATAGTVSYPEIKEFIFEEGDKFMLIASDGVWEFISSQECMELIMPFYEKNDLRNCCEFLYKESRKRWMREEEVVDDITMILVFF